MQKQAGENRKIVNYHRSVIFVKIPLKNRSKICEKPLKHLIVRNRLKNAQTAQILLEVGEKYRNYFAFEHSHSQVIALNFSSEDFSSKFTEPNIICCFLHQARAQSICQN